MKTHLNQTSVAASPTNKQKNLNKKIITWVAVVDLAAISALLAVGPLMDRPHNWVSDTIEVVASLVGLPVRNLVSDAIDAVATVLALPVRLYAFYICGDHGSWSLPVLCFLLAMSGLMWGIIVERIVWMYSKLNAPE